MKQNTLLEWYDEYNNGPEIAHIHKEPHEEPEQQKPEQEVKRIENSAELYKAAAITRALENKIMMLSGVFDIDDQKKEATKKEIKELAKMVGDIVNGI